MAAEHAGLVEIDRAAVVRLKKPIAFLREDFLDDRLLHSLLGFHGAFLSVCVTLELAAHFLKCVVNRLLRILVLKN